MLFAASFCTVTTRMSAGAVFVSDAAKFVSPMEETVVKVVGKFVSAVFFCGPKKWNLPGALLVGCRAGFVPPVGFVVASGTDMPGLKFNATPLLFVPTVAGGMMLETNLSIA